MKLAFPHSAQNAEPWQVGEIICIKVTAIGKDGGYECETIETFPADIKERHAGELAALKLAFETDFQRLHEAYKEATADGPS